MQVQKNKKGRARDPEKRSAIIKAARALFLARGFEATSMDAVSAAAGVSKPTVYGHFSSKDQLFQSVVAATCDQHNQPGNFMIVEGRSVKDALVAIGEGFLNLLISPEALALHRILMSEGQRISKISTLFYEAGPVLLSQRLSDYLASEAREGRLCIADPAKAAEHFLAMAKGMIWLKALLGVGHSPKRSEIKAHIASCAEAFLRAYGSEIDIQPPGGDGRKRHAKDWTEA